MVGRAACVLVLMTASAAAADPDADALTGAERRMLDGAYLYLVSPEYCDPALPADRLRSWVASLIRRDGLAPEAAAAYLADHEARLRLIAEAAFTGRKGKELCRSIFALRDTVPDLR